MTLYVFVEPPSAFVSRLFQVISDSSFVRGFLNDFLKRVKKIRSTLLDDRSNE